MFIPNNTNKAEEGDKVILKRDYQITGGFFTKGHIFTVINRSANGLILKDDDGNIIYSIPDNIVSLKVNLTEAQEQYKKIITTNNKLRVIEEICKHRGNGYDEYEHFFTCNEHGKGNLGRNSDECKVRIDCEKYAIKEKLRKYKLKEIKK